MFNIRTSKFFDSSHIELLVLKIEISKRESWLKSTFEITATIRRHHREIGFTRKKLVQPSLLLGLCYVKSSIDLGDIAIVFYNDSLAIPRVTHI